MPGRSGWFGATRTPRRQGLGARESRCHAGEATGRCVAPCDKIGSSSNQWHASFQVWGGWHLAATPVPLRTRRQNLLMKSRTCEDSWRLQESCAIIQSVTWSFKCCKMLRDITSFAKECLEQSMWFQLWANRTMWKRRTRWTFWCLFWTMAIFSRWSWSV